MVVIASGDKVLESSPPRFSFTDWFTVRRLEFASGRFIGLLRI